MMSNGSGFFHNVFDSIAQFAQQQLNEHRMRQERLALLHDEIERVVDASEPRIRLIGDYAARLADAVEASLAYGERLLRRLPPAITLSRRAWVQDPRVNAFFATADELSALLGSNPQVQEFFATGARECFALLLMVMREQESFSTGLEGEMLVRDVRRVTVSFSAHQLLFPVTSERALRQELKQRMLIYLAGCALTRINQLRDCRGDLEEQRRQLQAQMNALRGQARGLPLLTSADADERRLASLTQRLSQVEQDLADARSRLGSLDDYLEQVRQVLSQSATLLQLELLVLRLNRLGVKLADDSPEPGATLNLIRLSACGEQRISLLVRFCAEDLPVPDTAAEPGWL